MNVRTLAFALPLAFAPLALATVVAAARADDAPKTYKVALRQRWSAGEVVTLSTRETNVQNVVKVVDGKPVEDPQFGKKDTVTAYDAVIQCVEADADGYATKTLVYFAKYEKTENEKSDADLNGVHIRVEGKQAGRKITVLTPGKTLGEETLKWLDKNFGAQQRVDYLLAALEPKAEQAVGSTWKIGGQELADSMDDNTVPLDASKMAAEATLKGVEAEHAEYAIALDVALKGLPVGPGQILPWKDGGKGKVTFKYVRGLAADSIESTVEQENELDGVCALPEFEIHLAFKGHEVTTIAKGGEIPELPPVK